MKKILFCTVLLSGLLLVKSSFAQDDQEKKLKDEKIEKKIQLDKKLKELDEKKQTEELIIRKKGDKDIKLNVEIKGDEIRINGKPLADFKDENISINKKKITISGINGARSFDVSIDPDDYMQGFKDFKMMNDDKEEAYTFLGVSTEEADGAAKINQVTKESPAEKAGLQSGDIITKINDKKIENPEMLSDVVRSFKPKDEVTVYYKRDGKENTARTVLGERKESRSMSFTFNTPEGVPRAFSFPFTTKPDMKIMQDKLGNMQQKLELMNRYNGDNNFEIVGDMLPRHQKLGLRIQDTEEGNGVKVLEVAKESPAEKAGLKKDDIVTEVGGKKVSNTDEAREQLQENQDRTAYNIKAKRNGTDMNFDIKIPKKLKTANL